MKLDHGLEKIRRKKKEPHGREIRPRYLIVFLQFFGSATISTLFVLCTIFFQRKIILFYLEPINETMEFPGFMIVSLVCV